MLRNILLLSLIYLVGFGVVSSAQATSTTLPKVKNVQVLEKDTTSITLTWKKVKKVKQYQVKVLNASKKKVKQVIVKKTTKKITQLDVNTTYYFRVRAKRGSTLGKWSKLKKVTTNNSTDNEEADEEEGDNNEEQDDTNDDENETETFSLISTAFVTNGNIPALYTCDSDGISPPLSWSGVPSGTQSFLLTVLDIDAENFVHWGVKNIPASTTGAAQDSVPSGGTQLPNEGGNSEWFGPCPPLADGAHTYVFTLYALSASSLSSTTVDDAITEASSSTLGTAIISGEYDSN